MSTRGIFFEEGDARAAAAALVADGYAARVARERLAGEDDDEDQPWAVDTDAPSYALDLLVERYDGWLDAEPQGPGTGGPAPTPPPLPRAPRRRHRG